MKVGDLVGWRTTWSDGECRDELEDIGVVIEITKTYKKYATIYWSHQPDHNGSYPLDLPHLVSLE